MFIDLAAASEDVKRAAALILFEASKAVSMVSWPTLESSYDEVVRCCAPGNIAVGLVEDNVLTGWGGLLPMYAPFTFELHPLMVKPEFQELGYGTRILGELERMARECNVLNIFVGADDELGMTSLAGKDLYAADLFEELRNIKNLAGHPYGFYMKNGYRIIGVIPDANGPGKPDILMGKRIRPLS